MGRMRIANLSMINVTNCTWRHASAKLLLCQCCCQRMLTNVNVRLRPFESSCHSTESHPVLGEDMLHGIDTPWPLQRNSAGPEKRAN